MLVLPSSYLCCNAFPIVLICPITTVAHEVKSRDFSEFLVHFPLISEEVPDLIVLCDNVCCWGAMKRQSMKVQLCLPHTCPGL